MKLHKFEAESNQKAIQMVQKKLGLEAMIYSTKKTLLGVEIIAGTIDKEEQSVEINLESSILSMNNTQMLNKLNQQIIEIKDKLSDLNSNKHSGHQNDTVMKREEASLYEQVMNELTKMNFSYAFCHKYISQYMPYSLKHADKEQIIINLLTKVIQSMPENINQAKTIKVLVGATGTGKTLTVAKLANLYLKEYKPSEILLVTTDFNDIAGLNQLHYYSSVLGINVEYAHDQVEMKALIENSQCKMILIDTFGVSSKDEKKPLDIYKYFANITNKIDYYLAIPANTQESILMKTMSEFKSFPLKACIVTKEDESLGLASVISACAYHNLPISYIGNGQGMQNALKNANKTEIISKFIEMSSNSHYFI